MSCQFIGEEQKVIEPLIESIEIEWIKKRQNYYFSQIQSFLIQNPENKPNINHIDCNPKNNSVDNLEWCTQSENVKYAVKLGHHKCNLSNAKRGDAKCQV